MKKHVKNETNYRGFKDFHERQQMIAKDAVKKVQQARVKNNLIAWDENLPKGLSEAKFGLLPESVRNQIRRANVIQPDRFVLTTSTDDLSALKVNYAIIRELVKSGKVQPSEVKHTTLLTALQNVNGMFESKYWKKDFFNKKNKVLIIEGASIEITRLEHRQEDQFWRELVEFMRANACLVFISYQVSTAELAEGKVFIPSLAGTRTINGNLIKRSTLLNVEEI